MKYTAFLLLLFTFNQLTWSQDFSMVDEKVYAYPDFDDIETLSIRIQNDFENDIERARAAYLWITDNIKYDQNALRSVRIEKLFFYSDKYDYEYKLKKRQQKKMLLAFKNKIGLCEEFSVLFKELCNMIGLEAELILGVAKSASDIDSKNTIKNHGWNAVKINGKWKLVDVTWSAGYQDQKTSLWVRKLNDHFFLTPPEEFLTSHYPEDSKWQLIDTPISVDTFYKMPVFYSKYYDNELILNQNQTGTIKVLNDRIIIEFEKIDDSIPLYYVLSNSMKKKRLRIRKISENKFQTIIKYKSTESDILSLYLNNSALMSFKVASTK